MGNRPAVGNTTVSKESGFPTREPARETLTMFPFWIDFSAASVMQLSAAITLLAGLLAAHHFRGVGG